MAYPDLQTLFANGMGGFAAVQAGQQQAEAQQAAEADQRQKAALLQKQQLENQQQQAMNPLDLMFRQGQVNTQNAQLGGVQANSDMAQSQARVQQGTESAQIAAALSKASVQLGEDGMKKLKADSEKTMQSAAILRTIPVMQRPAALQQIVSQYGGDPNSPFTQAFLKVPPANMPDAMDKVGKGMAMASEKYIQDQALESQRTASAEKVANIHAGATLGAARIGADSRMQVANAAAAARREMALNKPKSTDQAIAMLASIPESERTQDEWNTLQQLSQQRLTERAAGANALPAQMTGNVTPTQNAAAATPFRPPVPQSAPAPQGMKQVGTSGGKPVYEDATGKRFIGK